MTKLQNQASWPLIRNLLAVLLSGVLCAILFALFMLYYYGPTGRYLLSNALLSPEAMMTSTFEDPDVPGSGALRYKFDRIEYSFFDFEKKQSQQVPLTAAEYSQFYQKISDEKSILEVSSQLVDRFHTSRPSRLTIFFKPVGRNSPVTEASGKPFQVIEFSSEGDYYRVELRGAEGKAGWVYFYHPKIQYNFRTNVIGLP